MIYFCFVVDAVTDFGGSDGIVDSGCYWLLLVLLPLSIDVVVGCFHSLLLLLVRW